jgi:SAM-dependent methyltransferase
MQDGAMTQNIYDNQMFFDAYGQLARSVAGLDGAPEWPALQALLPPLQGLRVLDLGCGLGWFCRWAAAQGAAEVLGLDISERMLGRARAMTADGRVRYRSADLETPCLPDVSFDIAYSSLAFHYLEALDGLLREVSRALRPGGHLIFSVEHPIYTAPRQPGWVMDAGGRMAWPVDSYLLEAPRRTDWLAPGVIKQHRTIGTTLNMLIGRGFTVRHVEEWGPSAEQIASAPGLARERERPMFLLVAAVLTA